MIHEKNCLRDNMKQVSLGESLGFTSVIADCKQTILVLAKQTTTVASDYFNILLNRFGISLGQRFQLGHAPVAMTFKRF